MDGGADSDVTADADGGDVDEDCAAPDGDDCDAVGSDRPRRRNPSGT